MRGFAALSIMALLVIMGQLHPARTAPSGAHQPLPPPSPQPHTQAPPLHSSQKPPSPPKSSPPRRRGSPRRRRTPSPPRSQAKQDPAPPRLVVTPQQPVVAPPPTAASNYTVGSTAPPRAASNYTGGSTVPPPPRAASNYTGGSTTLLVFGDSTVDPGNNNRLLTSAKANFLPYGINFYRRRPTGRFSNGRLATDMLAEMLGIARIIPGFFDPTLRLAQLRNGVSFASAGSGYDDSTASRLNVISFPNQIMHLWRYKILIRALLGPRRAERLVNRAIFVISTGTNDILFNYIQSNRSGLTSRPQYENYLIERVANYTQVMRMLGGRRFVFVGLPPIGCLPAARSLLGTGPYRCDEDLNNVAASFNSKLAELLNSMNNQQDARAVYIDTYTIIQRAMEDPRIFGLSEVWRGCCGSGVIEVGQTCRGRNTCPDPSRFLYWDAVHPTERTNQLITNAMMNSIGEIYS